MLHSHPSSSFLLNIGNNYHLSYNCIHKSGKLWLQHYKYITMGAQASSSYSYITITTSKTKQPTQTFIRGISNSCVLYDFHSRGQMSRKRRRQVSAQEQQSEGEGKHTFATKQQSGFIFADDTREDINRHDQGDDIISTTNVIRGKKRRRGAQRDGTEKGEGSEEPINKKAERDANQLMEELRPGHFWTASEPPRVTSPPTSSLLFSLLAFFL